MILKLYFWLIFISFPIIIVSILILLKRKNHDVVNLLTFRFTMIFLAWVLPPLGLYSFFYFLKPTYLLILLPPFTIFGCYFLSKIYNSKTKFLSIVFSIVLLQFSFFYLGNQLLPEPLHRLTYDYLTKKEILFTQLKLILANHNDKNIILVWDKESSITVYITRLMNWSNVIVIPDDELTTKFNSSYQSLLMLNIQQLEPFEMKWFPIKKLNELPRANLLLISNYGFNRFEYKLIESN